MSRRHEQAAQNQKAVFDFLVSHIRSGAAFTKRDLEAVTTWTGQSFETYWSKQFKQLMVRTADGTFRVGDRFRPLATWEKFQQHVTQVRDPFPSYSKAEYEKVLTYEFFMPLTNEALLRTALDALFYKDTVLAKLRAQDWSGLENHFERREGEMESAYLERACARIADFFVGYSISHVGGRYRAEKLSTVEEAARIQADSGRYLIDETTAVVRFIFPCKDQREVELVEWFFRALFTESIIQVVNGEAEIWMVESGMRNRIHIWRVEGT